MKGSSLAMNDLPEDLAHPRSDHAALASIIVGSSLFAILVALVTFWAVTR